MSGHHKHMSPETLTAKMGRSIAEAALHETRAKHRRQKDKIDLLLAENIALARRVSILEARLMDAKKNAEARAVLRMLRASLFKIARWKLKLFLRAGRRMVSDVVLETFDLPKPIRAPDHPGDKEPSCAALSKSSSSPSPSSLKTPG